MLDRLWPRVGPRIWPAQGPHRGFASGSCGAFRPVPLTPAAAACAADVAGASIALPSSSLCARTSAKNWPVPSSTALPVKACQRCDRDIDIGRVELDREADAAGHLGRDDAWCPSRRTARRPPGRARSCSGSAAACTRPASGCRGRSRRPGRGCGICQSVVCLRSPAQWPLLPFRTAYQHGSCCQ